jgi:hypothetical protein
MCDFLCDLDHITIACPRRLPVGNYEKLLIHYKRYKLGFVIIIICPIRGISIDH